MRHPEKYEIFFPYYRGKNTNKQEGPKKKENIVAKEFGAVVYGKSTVQLVQAADNRTIIVNMVANMITNDR